MSTPSPTPPPDAPRRAVRSRTAGRALLVAALAVTVASVVIGAAATLPIADQGVGAGSTPIASCDADGLVPGYDVVYDTTEERYEVPGVVVDGIASSCDGAQLEVVLAEPDGTVVATAGPVTISGSSVSLPLAASPAASLIGQRYVLIKG